MRSAIRKPSIKKSISSRTSGRVTRTVRKISNPTYGRKGVGYIKDPKKAAYNKYYNATSYSLKDISKTSHSNYVSRKNSNYSEYYESLKTDTYILTPYNLPSIVREYPQVVGIIRRYYIKRIWWGIILLFIAFPCVISISSPAINSPTLFFIGLILIGISIYLFHKSKQYRQAYKDACQHLYKPWF